MGIFYLTGSVNTSYIWQVPVDWNNADNQIVCIGGGAAGTANGAGGGGGACAILNNVTLTPGALLYYRIGGGGTGSGANGAGTWVNIIGSNAQPTSIAQGCYAEGGTGIVGGRASASFGNSVQSGGSASSSNSSGGGGAGGTTGAGGTSAAASPSAGGAGGTVGGGAGGASATSGNGGTGSAGTTFAATQVWSGPDQAYYSSVVNVGPGGGGGGLSGSGSGSAGAGGLYGGGGGGCASSKTQGNGTQGGIIIRYTVNSSQYALQSTPPITFNDINTIWMASNNQISLGDPEVRYLINSGVFSPGSMTLPPLSNIDMQTALNKPTTKGGTATYSTPGTYTFYLPIYKYINIQVVGGGGGEGGSGCLTTICTGTAAYNCCGYPGNCCANQNCATNPNCPTLCNQLWCGCNVSSTQTNTGSTGSAGGTTSVSISGTLILQGTGGTGGTGGSNTAGSNGTNGTGSFGSGYTGTTGVGSNGGGDLTLGGNGGNGGKAITTFTHYVTTNYPLWANASGVVTLTLVVGTGGTGGSGNTANCSGAVAGANGGNGSVTISWS